MALIGKIREKTQLLVIIVSLGLLFFIARELIGFSPLSSNKSPIIGVVAGQKITLRSFQDQFSTLQRRFFLDYEQSPSEEATALLRNELWKDIIRDIVYEKLCQQVGLTVTEDELVDMVQGDHIHPDLQASFINPETKTFDKKELLGYLQSLSQSGQSYQMYWYNIEKNLAKSRCKTKFEQLMSRSVFVNSLEARHKFVIDNTSVDFQYVYIPYHTIKDAEVSVKEEMLKSYLQKYEDVYQAKESKEIHYVTFPILASENDQIDFNKELALLKQDFYKTQEDSLFASVHTDSNPALVYLTCTEQDLPTSLNQQKSTLQQGMVIGPVAEGNSGYKLYKLTKVIAGKPKKYEITVIEKTLTPSDETKEAVFKKVDDFLHQVANKTQFEAQAAANNLHIYHAEVGKEDIQVGNLTHARELVRWVYNEAQVGKISPMFELSENYVVAMVTGQTRAGLIALDKVRDDIKQKVVNEEKAKMITSKLESISTAPFDTIIAQYGKDVKLFTATGIKFNTTRLEGIGLANKTISQAFALEPGQRSKIIAEPTGIVLAEIKQRHLPTLPDSWKAKQKEQAKIEGSRQTYQIFKALEKLAKVQDYRYKYY